MATVPPPDIDGLVIGGERRLRRRNTQRVGLAAAAVLLLGGGIYGGTQLGDDRSPDAGVADQPGGQSPTRTPTATRSWTLLSDEMESEDPLPAGRYGLTVAENADSDLPWAVVRAPAGCEHFSTWILSCPDEGGQTVEAQVGYWTLYAVHPDPCRTESDTVDTADDAVAALQQQRYSQVSQARAVTLDGYDGRYVELRIPERFDFAACPRFYPWDIDADGGLPYYQSPGLHRLWILDVDGDLAVIDATGRDEPASAMVDSLELVPRTE